MLSRRSQLMRLLALVVLGGVVGVLSPSLLIALAAIVAIIMIHEGGHLLAARRCGMKTTEYFLGFGPRIWSFQRGEMEYGVKAIPAGGYVKIIGMTRQEEIDPADESRSYRAQGASKRLLVGFAGIGAQIILALILAFAVVMAFGAPNNSLVVKQLATWSGAPVPARVAGLQTGDTILSVNGHRVTASSDITSFLKAPPSSSAVVVDRAGRSLTLSVTPVLASHVHNELLGGNHIRSSSANRPLIGVSLTQGVTHYDPVAGVGKSFQVVWSGIVGLAVGMGHLVSPSGIAHYAHIVTTKSGAQQAAATGNRPESIVGIVRTTAQAEQTGAVYFISMIIIVDLAIALLNLLPVLPLDGGHIAIAAYEGIRSRRGKSHHADLRPFIAFSGLVMILLLGLVVTSVWLDIAYPIAAH